MVRGRNKSRHKDRGEDDWLIQRSMSVELDDNNDWCKIWTLAGPLQSLHVGLMNPFLNWR